MRANDDGQRNGTIRQGLGFRRAFSGLGRVVRALGGSFRGFAANGLFGRCGGFLGGSGVLFLSRRVGCFLGSGGLSGALLGAFLGLFPGDGLVRVVAGCAFLHADGIEETGDAIGRLCTDRNPMLRALDIQHDAIGVVLAEQRIVAADALDEAAVTRAARIGDDDAVIRPLLSATA